MCSCKPYASTTDHGYLKHWTSGKHSEAATQTKLYSDKLQRGMAMYMHGNMQHLFTNCSAEWIVPQGLGRKGTFLYVNSELCNAGKCILMFQQVSIMAELTKHEIYLSNLRAVFCDQSVNQFVCADSQFHTLCERTWRFTPASGVLKRNTFT